MTTSEITPREYAGQRQLTLHGEVRVLTDNSVWLLRPTVEAAWYQRFPRQEGPRKEWEFQGGRLSDAVWMPMRRCWLIPAWGGEIDAVRVLPGVGPRHGYGVHSSMVHKIEGDYELLEPDEEDGPLPCRFSFWQPIETPDGPSAWLRLTDLEPDKEVRAKHQVELFRETKHVKTWDLWNTRADGHETLIEAAVGSIPWRAVS